MRRQTPARSPIGVEMLEGRALLSAAGTSMVSHHVALNGQLSGSFELAPENPDTGRAQVLTGSGTVSPLGQVKAGGSIESTGFIARGRAHGSFTLSNAVGSVTIELTGRPQSGFASIPTRYVFKIISTTGAYLGAKDSGKATLFEAEADAVPVGGPSIIVGPIFGLTLHSS